LSASQITELIQLADLTGKDVFYDLGSGIGRVVIQVTQQTKVRKTIGIENYPEPYEEARKTAINKLTKKQLKRIDFWYGEMDTKLEDGSGYFYDLNDATVVYYSLHETLETVEFFQDLLQNRRVKIITKDLPWVGYKSVANRSNPDCHFYLMHNPALARIKNKTEWAESVLGTKGVTVEHVYSYYAGQLAKRKEYYDKKAITQSLLELQILISDRF
jgi:hypothetical protein